MPEGGDAERLVVLLEARINDFEKNIAKASGTATRGYDRMRRGSQSATRDMEQDMQRSTTRMNQMLAGFSTKIGSYGKAFAGGLVGGFVAGGVAGIASQIADVAKSVAAVGDEAKRAGVSVKAFQEWKYVAEQNRIGVDQMTDGLKELNLRADEFVQTGKGSAAEAFQRLGYGAEDLKKKLADPSALLLEIIDRLGKMDKAAQIRISDELFGGSAGERFVELLDQGEAGIRATIDEAHRLGVVMDESLIKSAAELDRRFNAVSNTVGTALKTAIVSAAESLTDFINAFNGFQAERSEKLGERMAALGKERLDIERQLGELRAKKERGESVGDGFFGSSIGESTFGEAEYELNRRMEALAAEEAKINEVLESREKLKVETPSSTWTPPKPPPGGLGASPAKPSASEKADARAIETVANLIKQFEGFSKKAYWDVNAFRAGYGSDTTTRSGGAVEKIKASTTVSLADANRDLSRRIAEFQNVIKSQIGGDMWSSFDDEQKAALTSVAYNYGELPDRIVQAIEQGNPSKIGEAIRDLGDDNAGVNRDRRAKEADLFNSGSGSGATPAIIRAREYREEIERINDSYSTLGTVGLTALEGLNNALADGKLEGRELLQILVQVAQKLIEGFMNQKGPPLPEMAGNAGGGGIGGMVNLFTKIFGLFGFADGGYTGSGGRNQFAGAVHKGEVVFSQDDVRRHGGPAATEALRRGGAGFGGQAAAAGSSVRNEINFHNAPNVARREEKDDGQGNQRMDIWFEKQMANAASKRGSAFSKAMQGTYGVQRQMKRR